MEQGTIALVVLFVIVVVLGSLYALRTRTNVATETANIQTIITSAQSLLKGSDGYYYYTQGVKNGDIVKLAEDGIYFNGLNDNVDMNKYQGKKIKVVAKAELVQAKHGVFEGKWGLKSDTTNATDKIIYDKLKGISDAQGNKTKSE